MINVGLSKFHLLLFDQLLIRSKKGGVKKVMMYHLTSLHLHFRSYSATIQLHLMILASCLTSDLITAHLKQPCISDGSAVLLMSSRHEIVMQMLLI